LPNIKDIEILDKLGEGGFGNVYKAFWNKEFVSQNNEIKFEQITVALKELKILDGVKKEYFLFIFIFF
jgi:serine/threonine protein kinase